MPTTLSLVETLLFFVLGGFLIFLAFTVTRDNFGTRLNRLCGGLLFFAGLGAVFLALGSTINNSDQRTADVTSSIVYQLHVVWELFFPCLVLFTLTYPYDRLREMNRARITFLLLLPPLFHLVVMIAFSDITAFLRAVDPAEAGGGIGGIIAKPFLQLVSWVFLMLGYVHAWEERIFGFVNMLYLIGAVGAFESGRRWVSEPRIQRQTTILAWGFRVALGLLLAAALPALLSTKPLVPQLAQSIALITALVVGAGSLAYAIVAYQFLDVRSIFRQSLIYSIASAVLVGAYVLLGMRLQSMLTPVFGDRAETISYLLLIFVLLIFQPISSWLDDLIRSMFIRTRTDHRNILERFSRQVISVFDARTLRQTIEDMLRTALLVEDVHFVLFDDTVGEYVLQDDNAPSGRGAIIERDDLMLRGINLLDSPTPLNLMSHYESGSRLAELLRERRIRLILPMKDAKHLLGFVALTEKAAGYRYSSEDMNLLGVLSNQMVTALTNARLYADSLERVRLQEEVNMARQIQLDLLPQQPPMLPCAEISAQSIPSRTVGGDFYDFVLTDNDQRLAIVIADASGKGMPAALLMAQIQAMIRAEVSNGTPIPRLLGNMNTQILRTTSSEKYVTLFYAMLDMASHTLHYSNAGHNYPVLVRANGEMELLVAGGPIIGALPGMEFAQTTVQLHHEDVLFLFTDGLSEAMDCHGTEYGEPRIRELVRQHRTASPGEIMQRLLDDVRSHDATWPPQDDTTVIAIKMNTAGLPR